MKKYVIEYEMENGENDLLNFHDEAEAMEAYEDLKSDSECNYAILKCYLVYGGICQAEMTMKEYKK